MSLLNYDPFRDLERLADQLRGSTSRGVTRSFPMDAYRRGEEFHVELDMPGFDSDSIEITVEQNVLTVRAERIFEPESDDEIIVNERPQGTFQRQLLLSQSLDSDKLNAHYDDGVLRLTIPVAERAKPRRIEVGRKDPSQPHTIEGQVKGGNQEPETPDAS